MRTPLAPPRRITSAELVASLKAGWQTLVACRRASLAVGGIAMTIGLALAALALNQGLAPLVPALVGGFLLVGPLAMVVLASLALGVSAGEPPTVRTLRRRLDAAPRGLWALLLFCLLMDFIWLTDAGTLYSFMIGERRDTLLHMLPLDGATARFQAFSAVMGFVLANVVFAVSAHAVPLMLRGERSLVRAVMASVKAVATSPLAHGAWAALLAAAIFASLLLPPLLCVALPWLGYAGTALNRTVFPE